MSLASSGSTNLALAAPTLLTVDYTASISGSSTLALDYIIYSGSGISGTQLFSRHAETTLVTGTNTYQGTTFDSLGLGWRQNNGSLSSSLDINSVAVTLTSVPEPTTVAMMAGGIGLFFGIERLVKRRRG
jgi:hypothetical protein